MPMSASEMPFHCPFCQEQHTVRCGEFPYVRSQLLVTFEHCAGLPAHTSAEALAAAASELADALLAATYQSDARELVEQAGRLA
jgi:hypothetical protein